MVPELKLRKAGDSPGIILPKEALAHLQVEERDTVTMTQGPDGSLTISPHTAEAARQMEVVQDVMNRFPHTLRELAK